MSRICPLFSGSTGNSTYIGTSNGGILVDVGASARAICSAIEAAGGRYDEIKAVAVTHEHIDHVKGLKVFLKKTNATLIASALTLEALAKADRIPEGANVVAFEGGMLDIDGIAVSRFPTSHDCKGSSGYSFVLPDGRKVSVCTDLGIVTKEVRDGIIHSDMVLIESNHDIEMLKHGPYPSVLKMRIMSEHGHISNNACAAELRGLILSGTKRFILGHLSMKNNTPMLAKSCAESALIDIGAENGKDYILKVAKPCNNGVMVL